MATVKGRGRLAVTGVEVEGGGAGVRVEDERNDAFWLELHIDAEDLRHWLGVAEAMAATGCDCIRAVYPAEGEVLDGGCCEVPA